MPDRIEFRYSPLRQAALLVIGCLMVAGSWRMAVMRSDTLHRVVGWAGVGLFTLGAYYPARRLIFGDAQFVFDRVGITFRSGNFGLVPWTEIKEYEVVTLGRHKYLALIFHDPMRVVPAMQRQAALESERVGCGHVALSFIGLSLGVNEAVAFIEELPCVE